VIPQLPDDTLLAEIESFAVQLARNAGDSLSGHFGSTLAVEYKDKKESDPVSAADRDTEKILTRAIAERFPGHGILGEEGTGDEGALAPDFVWALDPLDGTKNFLAGLPVYACSIGVLHRGVPVVGAIYLPWPTESGGVVYHARVGGGAFADDEPISAPETAESRGGSLVGLPGHFGAAYRVKKPMRSRLGEPRVIGSIAYELAMVARGVLHYSLIGGAHLWDMAGGAVLVAEAEGLMMRRRRANGIGGLLGAVRWEPTGSLVRTWESGVTTMGQLRKWRASMVLGSPGAVRFVTAHLQRRILLRRRLAGVARRVRLGRRGDRPGA
jgi:myo-inositol-1(or 4)-monophosphatase